MDAIVEKRPRFLPALADAIIQWFPELGGRALAVSEVTVNKENIPTLPLAMVAFVRGTSDQPVSNRYNFDMEDAFVVEFWLEPARYKKASGATTPFWSYYDYEAIRDTLLSNLAAWDYAGPERVTYRGLNIEADELAVTLTFAFVATMRWCATPIAKPVSTIKGIGFNLCPDQTCCLPDCLDDKPEDPCHPCP